MSLVSLKDLNLYNKRIVIREDFNVPMCNGIITSDTRIKAALSTIKYALKQGAAVILLSHLGRPEEGRITPQFSLAPVARRLQTLLKRPVRFIPHWIEGFDVKPLDVVLCENVRFQKGEKKNDPTLAKKIAKLADIFVMDAFATAHRSEASTVGAAQFSKQACAGLLLIAELNALARVFKNATRPLLAIVGGSKVFGKLKVLNSLIRKVDKLILGGGIANTFLVAQGYTLGKSLVDNDLIAEAKCLFALAQQYKVEIILPIDVVVANELSATAKTCIKTLTEISDQEMVLDIGTKSIELYKTIITSAATILWNGPVGVFEMVPFAAGTQALSLAIAESKAFSVAGGGDTLAAIEKYGIDDKINYISTGGGAFLEFIEDENLPALTKLQKKTLEV